MGAVMHAFSVQECFGTKPWALPMATVIPAPLGRQRYAIQIETAEG